MVILNGNLKPQDNSKSSDVFCNYTSIEKKIDRKIFDCNNLTKDKFILIDNLFIENEADPFVVRAFNGEFYIIKLRINDDIYSNSGTDGEENKLIYEEINKQLFESSQSKVFLENETKKIEQTCGLTWEINTSPDDITRSYLGDADKFHEYSTTIADVITFFSEQFSDCLDDKMFKSKMFIDCSPNDSKSGARPIFTPVSNSELPDYSIVKLHVNPSSQKGLGEYFNTDIAFQLSHELMHLLFHEICGANKPKSTKNNGLEETICVAMSLITVSKWRKDVLEEYEKIVQREPEAYYRKGVDFVNYNDITTAIKELKVHIEDACNYYRSPLTN
ncbi:MAG: hypothetical protein R3Y07_08535 [Eubacteriales bacterium]